MGRRDDLITVLLVFFMILIFGVTVYFCLDMFGIIEVPDKYSIVSLLGNRVSDLSVAVNMEDTITEDNIDEWINVKTKVVDDPNGRDTENADTTAPDLSNSSQATTTTTTAPVVQGNRNVVNRMYYGQLDVYGKLIYLQFIEHKAELITGTYVADFGSDFNDLLHQDDGAETLEKAFQLSVNSLMFDNPELFYLDITKMYMSTEITSFGPIKSYKVKIGPEEGKNYLLDCFQDPQVLQATVATIENFKNEFAYKMINYSDYKKIKAVHEYIIENTQYDQTVSKDNIYNIYGAIIQHTAVCEGYSKTMKYLLDAANVPCVIVCGIARNSNGETESHAWNYVKLDNAWYAIDPTWDDPVIVGTGYISNGIYSRYFLKGSKEFNQDHCEDGNIVSNSRFIYPTISEENYTK